MKKINRITVLGLSQLGCITSLVCSKHYFVHGVDHRTAVISELNENTPIIYNSLECEVSEPGFSELLKKQRKSKKLTYGYSLSDTPSQLLWITYDTPVDTNGNSDVDSVLGGIRYTLKTSKFKLVLISSQLPVGSCGILEKEFPDIDFVYIPENLRLGHGIETFENQKRIIVGVRTNKNNVLLKYFLEPFLFESKDESGKIIFMKTESAEMVKHALNSFLALSITFINEISVLSKSVGADPEEVSLGLKSEPRIGKNAYLNPGGPYGKGTLERDVVTLTNISKKHKLNTAIVDSIKYSNDHHETI